MTISAGEVFPVNATLMLFWRSSEESAVHVSCLVQNADDNSYAPGALPALEFVLRGGSLLVLNNEVGGACRRWCLLAGCCWGAG